MSEVHVATSAERSQPVPRKDPRMERRAALAATGGTALEYFDFAIFGLLAATVFPTVFFQELGSSAALIASFATYGVAFAARPIGSVVFSTIGDRRGRRGVLIATLWIMGLATVFMGLLPGYAAIGIAAPIILVVLRLIQGIASGGEISGAQILALEHAPTERRGRAGSSVAVASPIAQALATLVLAGLTAGLSREDFVSWGWRVPLVASIVLLAFAAWVRSGVSETPEFVASEERSERRSGPLEVLRRYPGTMVLLLVGYAAPAGIYPMVTAFGVAYMTSAGGLSPSTTFVLFLFAQLVGICAALLGGRVADRIGARNTMLTGLVVLAIAFVPLFPLVHTGNVVLIGICTAGVVGSVVFVLAAQASFYAYAFPVRMRYFGSSITYAATNTLFGGTAAVVATWLLGLSGGDVRAVTAYGVVLVAASVLAVLARPARPTPFLDGGEDAER
jgi:MFS family permease